MDKVLHRRRPSNDLKGVGVVLMRGQKRLDHRVRGNAPANRILAQRLAHSFLRSNHENKGKYYKRRKQIDGKP
jgi:hypothetical protein